MTTHGDPEMPDRTPRKTSSRLRFGIDSLLFLTLSFACTCAGWLYLDVIGAAYGFSGSANLWIGFPRCAAGS